MDYDWNLTRIFKNDDELKSTIDKINLQIKTAQCKSGFFN